MCANHARIVNFAILSYAQFKSHKIVNYISVLNIFRIDIFEPIGYSANLYFTKFLAHNFASAVSSLSLFGVEILFSFCRKIRTNI